MTCRPALAATLAALAFTAACGVTTQAEPRTIDRKDVPFGLTNEDTSSTSAPRVAPSSTPYAVTESAASGYRLSSITCTDGDSAGTVATRTASIKVAAGETVRCTFVNTKLRRTSKA